MLDAVAFCPHPPVLVPDVAQGAAPELDDLRAACREAIRRVWSPGRRLVLIGSGPEPRQHAANARGTLAGYGVPLEIPLGSDEPGPVELPLSLTIGAWLVRDALGPGTGAVGFSVAPCAAPAVAFDRPDATALVVMGDGSACRSTSAPGYLDERSAGYDAAVAAALGSGDPDRLPRDTELGADLQASGATVWATLSTALPAGAWTAEVLYDAAPYGVGYFVATWT